MLALKSDSRYISPKPMEISRKLYKIVSLGFATKACLLTALILKSRIVILCWTLTCPLWKINAVAALPSEPQSWRVHGFQGPGLGAHLTNFKPDVFLLDSALFHRVYVMPLISSYQEGPASSLALSSPRRSPLIISCCQISSENTKIWLTHLCEF